MTPLDSHCAQWISLKIGRCSTGQHTLIVVFQHPMTHKIDNKENDKTRRESHAKEGICFSGERSKTETRPEILRSESSNNLINGQLENDRNEVKHSWERANQSVIGQKQDVHKLKKDNKEKQAYAQKRILQIKEDLGYAKGAFALGLQKKQAWDNIDRPDLVEKYLNLLLEVSKARKAQNLIDNELDIVKFLRNQFTGKASRKILFTGIERYLLKN